MYDYADEIATAVALIAEFGRPMTLTVTTESETPGPAWDPGATETSTVTTTTELVGVQTSFSALEQSGDLVQQGDVKLLFDGTTPIPSTGRIDGLSIIDVQTVRPGDAVVLYRVQARR